MRQKNGERPRGLLSEFDAAERLRELLGEFDAAEKQ